MESPENRVPVPSGRLEAAVVDDSFEAGHVNTARLIIKNPFDVPVKILAVVPPKASTLRDLESPRWFEKEKIADHDGAAHKPVETSNRWLKNIFPFLGDQFGFGSPEIQFGDVSGSLQSASIEIAAAENSKVTIDQPLPRFSRLNISSKPGSEITIAGQPAESLSDRSDPVQIGPHCEVVQHFPFETRGWLLFKPTKVNISVQIRYQVSSEERDQGVSASLDVKPPLSSMVVGSLAGAILGTLA